MRTLSTPTKVERQDSNSAMTTENRELTKLEIAYDACVSLAGEHQVFAYSSLMRVIQSGWIFIVFLLAAIYTANLTTILVAGRVPDTPLQGLQDLMEREDKVLCLNNGSANVLHAFYSLALFSPPPPSQTRTHACTHVRAHDFGHDGANEPYTRSTCSRGLKV
jgi:hypothetical protein